MSSTCVSVSGIDDDGRQARAAMLKRRFADTISKATQQLQQKSSEKKNKPSSSPIGVLERKRIRRDLMVKRERERQRQALENMAKSVDHIDIFQTLLELHGSYAFAHELYYGRPVEDDYPVAELEEGEIPS